MCMLLIVYTCGPNECACYEIVYTCGPNECACYE